MKIHDLDTAQRLRRCNPVDAQTVVSETQIPPFLTHTVPPHRPSPISLYHGPSRRGDKIRSAVDYFANHLGEVYPHEVLSSYVK